MRGISVGFAESDSGREPPLRSSIGAVEAARLARRSKDGLKEPLSRQSFLFLEDFLVDCGLEPFDSKSTGGLIPTSVDEHARRSSNPRLGALSHVPRDEVVESFAPCRHAIFPYRARFAPRTFLAYPPEVPSGSRRECRDTPRKDLALLLPGMPKRPASHLCGSLTGSA